MNKNIKDYIKKKEKQPTKKNKKKIAKIMIVIKIIIIAIFAYGYYYTNSSYENSISLLAVNENQNGEVYGGSLIELSLTIKPGSGQTYVNLNTIEEVDTQISIINSQKIACELFEKNCQKYDFYYDFKGSALLLKGPSASSAIAILTAKTLNKEKIKNNIAITGSLNSGGIIGNVGGIDEKVAVAEEFGFKKILIPIFSDYNQTKTENNKINVIKVMDIIEAYNQFNGNKYSLKTYPINKEQFTLTMKELSNNLCNRADMMKKEIKINNKNESEYILKALNSINSSENALKNENYYSRGSFCYNANLNLRLEIEKNKNLSLKETEEQIKILEEKLNKKYFEIKSDNYKSNIKTMNDFYVYLILIDRIDEAKTYIEETKTNPKEIIKNIEININENTLNETNSSINESINTNEFEKNEQIRKKRLYSYALERYETVKEWEKLIEHTGTTIKFTDNTIKNACDKINREISIKSELLSSYSITFFNEEINEVKELQSVFSNHYLCIYKGLELEGKINTILNSVGISNNKSENYSQKLIEFTNSRISLNSNGDFPLIPYIYHEYSTELNEIKDYSSSMLYSNYALSYADLNLFLEKEKITKSYINLIINKLYENPIFIIAIMLFIGFLN